LQRSTVERTEGEMAVKVGINGFGRIGRCLVRACLVGEDIDFVAVNDLTDPKTLAHLLKYDSLFGTMREKIAVEPDAIIVGRHRMRVFSDRDPQAIDWTSCGAEIVIEATGQFTDGNAARKHIHGSVKKVIITAPAKHEDVTIVLGVNEGAYEPTKHSVISNASCTTNCLAPLVKVLHDNFHIEKGWMTTIHSYTNDQNILDFPHKDLRRARAAAMNIIPTKTGAAEALGLVIPDLKGKLSGAAMRVPTPDVSVVDFVAIVSTPTTENELNAVLKAAAENGMRDVLAYTQDPIVSSDLRHDSHSSIVDGGCTRVLDGNLIRTVAWYDNEWGYANRVADLIRFITSKDLVEVKAEQMTTEAETPQLV
jgi:glyceraldehyde 3-phosphate dehydrogenase